MSPVAESPELKSCCATLYESDFARLLLGDSFHPGGQRLTARLAELMGLRAGVRVLDVASGKGESAIFLASRFGCEVVGVDFGHQNVREAAARAEAAGVSKLVSFVQGDAERIEFPDGSFDAIICECAFCTFPDKRAAAAEFARILRPRGWAGLSDLVRSTALSKELEGLLAWVACIAGARPAEEYADYLREAGMKEIYVEAHGEALTEMVRDIQAKLLGVELMSKLKKIELTGIDLEQAKSMARAASEAVQEKRLSYAIIVSQRA